MSNHILDTMEVRIYFKASYYSSKRSSTMTAIIKDGVVDEILTHIDKPRVHLLTTKVVCLNSQVMLAEIADFLLLEYYDEITRSQVINNDVGQIEVLIQVLYERYKLITSS